MDAVLQVGATKDAIGVKDTGGQVEFNSVKEKIALDTKLVAEMPNFGRNPFLLATIDPSVTFEEGGSNRPMDAWRKPANARRQPPRHCSTQSARELSDRRLKGMR